MTSKCGFGRLLEGHSVRQRRCPELAVPGHSYCPAHLYAALTRVATLPEHKRRAPQKWGVNAGWWVAGRDSA